MLLLPAIALAAPATARAQDAGPQARKYALLVAVRFYRHAALPDLKYPENDVEELARLLQAGSAGFRVTLLTSTRGRADAAARPTAANIRAALKGMLDRATKHDTVVVALAGHGLQQKVADPNDPKKVAEDAFFCPADARPSDSTDRKELTRTLLSLRELFGQLKDSGAGVKLLLVDACRNDPNTARGLDLDTLPRPPRGTAALFSCSSGQRAYETAKLGGGHGVFFHFVLEGLRGKAKNRDGEVTWDDLSGYVKRQVTRQVPRIIGGGARQAPHLVADLTGDSPVLVRTSPGAAALARGRIHLARQEYAQAIQALNEAVRLDSDEPRAYACRALALAMRRHHLDAVADANDALRLDPGLTLAYAVRGMAQAELGQPDAALADYTEALRLGSGNAALHHLRGNVNLRLKRYAQAVADYSRAIHLDPRHANAYAGRGRAYQGLGDARRAKADLGRARRLGGER
jgi:Tfp pilus assembly protein PilF